jgi:UDP-N-acetylmuramate dehydrogenase
MSQISGQTTSWIKDRLAATTGLVTLFSESLANHTTFRIGGPAEIFVRVETEPALEQLMLITDEKKVPVQMLGQGSNILVPDEGVAGVVMMLDGSFREFHFDGERVDAGGGVALARLARSAAEKGLVGLEALAGFPSTVGGAVVMNAGCYGVEIVDLLESVTVIEPSGRRRNMLPGELGAEYRRTRLLGEPSIVTRARLCLQFGNGEAALARMAEINSQRRSNLPSGHPNAGSTFKNPPGEFAGRLIESCELKGVCRGGAQISDCHANVIVNLKGASANDVLELMLLAHHSVKIKHNISLDPELILVGELRERWIQGIAGDDSE